MVKDKKLYVVGHAGLYPNWLKEMGFWITTSTQEADLVMFTGGSDVNPQLYGEKKGHYTSFDEDRDNYEVALFNMFYKNGTPMIGICRGGQLFTVLSGGKLVQDSSHPSGHTIKTFDNKELIVTSSHHQQFLVKEEVTSLREGVDYNLIGWAERLSDYHTNGNDIDYGFPLNYKEPEIVYYKQTNALAIQSHPEWQEMNHPTVKYLQNLVEQLIDKTIWNRTKRTEKELV